MQMKYLTAKFMSRWVSVFPVHIFTYNQLMHRIIVRRRPVDDGYVGMDEMREEWQWRQNPAQGKTDLR